MVGELLYKLFKNEMKYPTEEDLPVLKETIKHLLYAINMTKDLIRWGELNNSNFDYFEPDLEFVDYLDIPNWDNGEDVYIPMFDLAEILLV